MTVAELVWPSSDVTVAEHGGGGGGDEDKCIGDKVQPISEI